MIDIKTKSDLVKTKEEIEIMRVGGRILAEVLFSYVNKFSSEIHQLAYYNYPHLFLLYFQFLSTNH